MNTNYHTIIQMPHIVNDLVRQATGRDPVQDIKMDYATVAQNKIPFITEFSDDPMIQLRNDGATVISALSVAIEPVQTGSGDPSPQNVRPISGWNAVKIFVSPTSEAADGKTYTIAFPGEIGTVYGGILNAVTGELTVNKAIYFADGSIAVNNVSHHVSGLYYIGIVTNLGAKETNPLPISNRFRSASGVAIGNCYITSNGRLLVAVLPDQSITTREAATQWFADNPTQFVYELETPQTYHLTPQKIQLLLGDNNIWSDAGTVSATAIKYETFSEVLPV